MARCSTDNRATAPPWQPVPYDFIAFPSFCHPIFLSAFFLFIRNLSVRPVGRRHGKYVRLRHRNRRRLTEKWGDRKMKRRRRLEWHDAQPTIVQPRRLGNRSPMISMFSHLSVTPSFCQPSSIRNLSVRPVGRRHGKYVRLRHRNRRRLTEKWGDRKMKRRRRLEWHDAQPTIVQPHRLGNRSPMISLFSHLSVTPSFCQPSSSFHPRSFCASCG